MLSAPTRSGKGVGVVIPNLLNWPDSVVVLDIKGENYDITAGYRAAHGQAVYAFSPFDEDARSHRWNPLTAVRTSPLHRVGDLLDHRPGLLPQRRRRHLVGSLLQRPGAQPVPRPGPAAARNARAAAHHRRDAAPVLGPGPVAQGPPAAA
ncbi:MAG: type IV secretory system conjugative DNA transfer family protein [Comamonadaceae bacterium]|nr:type IV secretory system conjugative DNA transfer family protein [Comamonadaceae bacterium]